MHLVGALVACLLLGLVSCQLDCDLPTNSELENVLGDVIRSGEDPQQPQITLLNSMNLVAISTVACFLLDPVSCQLDYALPTNSELENVFGRVIASGGQSSAASDYFGTCAARLTVDIDRGRKIRMPQNL